MPISKYTTILNRAKSNAMMAERGRKVYDTDGECIAHVKLMKRVVNAFGKTHIKIEGAAVRLTHTGFDRIPLPWNTDDFLPDYCSAPRGNDKREARLEAWEERILVLEAITPPEPHEETEIDELMKERLIPSLIPELA
jgi:hypothetical protein